MALVTARTFANNNVRPPAVAGTFYPGNAAELEASVRQYLERAKRAIGVTDGPPPKAVIAPHAGYVYSGLTAAAVPAVVPAVARRRAATVNSMLACIGTGIWGLVLHYDSNVEFKREMNPDLEGWTLTWEALHAKSPPSLAPGAMAWIGVLGLVYAYGKRNPRPPDQGS